MPMPNRNYSSPSYRYGYNGKEKDDEVKGSGNSVAWENRILDPRLGRWFKLDAAARAYPGVSPYAFCANTLNYFKETDGNIIGTAIGAGLGFLVSGSVAAWHGASREEIIAQAGKGALVGGFAGAIFDCAYTGGTSLALYAGVSAEIVYGVGGTAVLTATSGMVAGGAGYTYEKLLTNEPIKPVELAYNVGAGGVFALGGRYVIGPLLSKSYSVVKRIRTSTLEAEPVTVSMPNQGLAKMVTDHIGEGFEVHINGDKGLISGYSYPNKISAIVVRDANGNPQTFVGYNSTYRGKTNIQANIPEGLKSGGERWSPGSCAEDMAIGEAQAAGYGYKDIVDIHTVRYDPTQGKYVPVEPCANCQINHIENIDQ